MRRLKSAVFIGLLVAIAMIVSIYAPKDSKLGTISWYPTFPGTVVAIVYALAATPMGFNGVITVALDWAVNTVIYWGMWEIACAGMKKIKPTPKPTGL
jgi:hypothetical protein